MASSLGLKDNAELTGGDLAAFFGLPSAPAYFSVLLILKDVPEDVLGLSVIWMIVFIRTGMGGGEEIGFSLYFYMRSHRHGRPLLTQIISNKIQFLGTWAYQFLYS